jgi:hypothetical protein
MHWAAGWLVGAHVAPIEIARTERPRPGSAPGTLCWEFVSLRCALSQLSVNMKGFCCSLLVDTTSGTSVFYVYILRVGSLRLTCRLST